MEYPRWTIKITSKGQVTLPKAARDLLLVRDGDHLDAWIKDDTLVLRKSEVLSDSELLIQYARSRLVERPSGEVVRADASIVRESIGRLPVDTTALVRESRERP